MTAIIFKPLFPLLWIVVVSILAIGLFCWLEIKRKQKLLFARLIAVCIAVIALALLVLRPEQSIRKSSNIIVLTEDYSKIILDSLLTADSESQVYTINTTSNIRDSEQIENLRELIRLKGNISVIGQGIPDYALEYMDTTSIRFYPSQLPEGFTSIDYTKTFTVNQTSKLTGTFKSSRKEHKIKLEISGIAQDSAKVNAGDKPFSLHFKPKAAGLYSYTLTASDSTGTVTHTETVPVKVADQKQLSVLFLFNYPSAEIRFLKNFLEAKNHKLTLRYKISQDKYRTEFVNTPEKSVARINSKSLEEFDLIVTDASSLASLSNSERNEIEQSVRLGLGLITQINTTSLEKSVQKVTELNLSKIKTDSASLFISQTKLKTPATPVTISSDKKLFDVLKEPSGRVISGYNQNGLGRSAFTLLTQTYSLELSGSHDAYAEIWTNLIDATARKELQKYDLSFTTPFPYCTDEPIDFQIIASDKKPTLFLDSLEIPVTEDQLIENVWHGRFWNNALGWKTLTIKEDSTQYNFFVAHEDQWKSLRISNQQQALKKISSAGQNPAEQIVQRSIPLLIFFILFILASGFLWLTPKL